MNQQPSPELFASVWRRVSPQGDSPIGVNCSCSAHCASQESDIPSCEGCGEGLERPYNSHRLRKCLFLATRMEEERMMMGMLRRCYRRDIRPFVYYAERHSKSLCYAISQVSGMPYRPDGSIYRVAWHTNLLDDVRWLNQQLYMRYTDAAREPMWEREAPMFYQFMRENRELQRYLDRYEEN